jgi:serine/threonine protein kinase
VRLPPVLGFSSPHPASELLHTQADNILMSRDGDVVLADFGVAAARTRAVSMVNLSMPALLSTTFVGTPCWMVRM